MHLCAGDQGKALMLEAMDGARMPMPVPVGAVAPVPMPVPIVPVPGVATVL